MTHDHKPLEAYFRRINQQKEFTMFEYLKSQFSQLFQTETIVSPEPIPDPEPSPDFYRIEMFTAAYTSQFEDIPTKYSYFTGDHVDSETWMHIMDRFADMLSYHYGYDIKEQIYYSVKFPLNMEGEPGYGRSLNDDRLQLLLLANPDTYEAGEAQ